MNETKDLQASSYGTSEESVWLQIANESLKACPGFEREFCLTFQGGGEASTLTRKTCFSPNLRQH